MFSTIKSRVIAIYVLIMSISIIIAIFIGMNISRYYLQKDIYGDMNVIYKVDTGEELDSIANTEYFSEDRLINRVDIEENNNLQSTRIIQTSLIITAITVLILSALLLNWAYNFFVREVINIDSDKVSDFKIYRENLEILDDELVNNHNDIEKINSYVNHELKNSLAILKTKKISEDEFENYIDEIVQQIDDISALTTNRLSSTHRLDLLLLIANLVDKYSTYEIDFEFEDGNFEIEANATLLNRAIDNIINNAFKYGAEKMVISIYNKEGNVIVKLANDGEEIGAKLLDKIFDYKYRTRELQADGSGVGLALVKNIVELHNAGIYVESNEIETAFYLSFRTNLT